MAPSFTESARRAAAAAPIPIILTNGDNVADDVLNYRRKRGRELHHQCRVRDVEPCNFYKNVFWVVVGVGATVTAQNLVKYLY